MKKKISLKEKFFVAGSTGMVGGAVCRSLKKNGYGLVENGGKILAPKRNELDLLESEKVKIWFKKNEPSVVILAAAKVGGIYANSSYPADFILENIKIQTNIIEAAWKSGVKRFLFLGSSCIYPKNAPQPIKEDYLLKGELEKTNEPYAVAKIAGIKLCESLRRQYDFDAISLMPTNLYGTGDNYHIKNSHVMASLIKKFCDAKKNNDKKVICWGTGKPMREFLHVDDLGSAIVFCLENWDPKEPNPPLDNQGNPLTHLNVGTGLDISIQDLSKKIAENSLYDGEICWDKGMPDGTNKKLLDISKIRSLGWKHKISLDQGIKNTILDYEKL
tara:strand:- start:34615 stop:35607 length:993 start_codon:yes stop_codon:yes gene_type:complete